MIEQFSQLDLGSVSFSQFQKKIQLTHSGKSEEITRRKLVPTTDRKMQWRLLLRKSEAVGELVQIREEYL